MQSESECVGNQGELTEHVRELLEHVRELLVRVRELLERVRELTECVRKDQVERQVRHHCRTPQRAQVYALVPGCPHSRLHGRKEVEVVQMGSLGCRRQMLEIQGQDVWKQQPQDQGNQSWLWGRWGGWYLKRMGQIRDSHFN